MVEIRPYTISDEEAVAALWRTVFPNAPAWNDPVTDIHSKLTVQPELFFVAIDGSALIGTAMAGFDGHRGWVHLVAVSPECRRRGVGRALMTRVEDDLAAIGCHKLNLQVRESNRKAIGFYRELGYVEEDRISMAKRLEKKPTTATPADNEMMAAFLGSLKNPFLFADGEHIIRYMNKAAIAHYSDGAKLLGTNLLDCHNEESQQLMLEIFAAMKAGEEERLITDNEKNRVYMRAVRDRTGALLGYYERYEPPVKQAPVGPTDCTGGA